MENMQNWKSGKVVKLEHGLCINAKNIDKNTSSIILITLKKHENYS